MLSKRCWSKKEGQTTFILSYCLPLFPQNIGMIQHLWRTFSTNNKYVAADITSLNLVCSCTWESPQQISCCIGTAADIQPIFFTLVTRSLSPQKGLIWFTCWRSRLKIEVINALCLCPLLRIWGERPILAVPAWSKAVQKIQACGNEKPLWEWKATVFLEMDGLWKWWVSAVSHLSPVHMPDVGGYTHTC